MSFSLGNSSRFSPIMPEEFWEHLTRDQRPFSSYIISPDPLDSSSMLVLLFSSPHSFSVGFRSEDWDSHGKRFILCSVTIFVFILMFVLDCCPGGRSKCPTIRFLTEAVRFHFFICWYLIESIMPCISTRCSGPRAEKQAHNIIDPAVYLNVDIGYFFRPVCTKLICLVWCQKAIFFQFHLTIEASPIWRSSRVWQLDLLEFVFGWVDWKN